MAETPLDLASLPCPQGCRWERVSETEIALMLGAHTNVGSIVYEEEDGDEWWYASWFRDETNEWMSSDGEASDQLAADALLSALGLTPAPAAERPRVEIATIGHIQYGNAPAPAGRTFTEAEVRRACAWSIVLTIQRDTFGCDYPPSDAVKRILPEMEAKGHTIEKVFESKEIYERITAAIAAATDAGKDGSR